MVRLKRVRGFNPFAPKIVFADGHHRANPALFRCPCGGVMFDVTSRLAEVMSVLHHECDTCHARTACRKPRRTK